MRQEATGRPLQAESSPTLSIVLPAHNEADALPELIRRLTLVLEPITHAWEVVFVDDGSTDATWPLLLDATRADPRVRGVRLSRNFGHQIALTAGLAAAKGEHIVTMDADLQHPPEAIPELLAKAKEGYDVVYATRAEMDSEGWFKVRSAHAFYILLNRLTSLDLPIGGADFRYMSRRVVDVLNTMPERHRFLRGMTRWAGFRQGAVEYSRSDRLGGTSKYTLRHMMRFAFDAITSFSAVPLRIASFLGLALSAIGGFYFLYVVGVRILDADAEAGWASVIAVVLVLGGVQLACVGIIGQYVGRMYDEIKGRPLFVVWDETTDHDHSSSVATDSDGVRSLPVSDGAPTL